MKILSIALLVAGVSAAALEARDDGYDHNCYPVTKTETETVTTTATVTNTATATKTETVTATVTKKCESYGYPPK